MRPTKPAAAWLFRFAAAIQHEETFLDFIEDYPDQFPTMGGGS